MSPNRKPSGAEILQKFQAFDRNQDGKIDRQELGRLLQAIDKDAWTSARLDRLFRVIANPDGNIEYEEFLEWAFGNGGVETRDLTNFRKSVQKMQVSKKASLGTSATDLMPKDYRSPDLNAQSPKATGQTKAAAVAESWVHKPCCNGVEIVDSAPGELTREFAIVPDGGIFLNSVEVEIVLSFQCNVELIATSIFRGTGIFYTLDGSQPITDGSVNATNKLYDSPFSIDRIGVHIVRAVARLPSGKELHATARFVICHDALPQSIVSGVVSFPRVDGLDPEGQKSCDEATALQLVESIQDVVDGFDCNCSVKLGPPREFMTSEKGDLGEWLEVHCRFSKPWRGWLKNIFKRDQVDAALGKIPGVVNIVQTVSAPKGLTNMEFEMWPSSEKSSEAALVDALKLSLLDCDMIQECPLALEACAEWLEPFAAPGGSQEQRLREVMRLPGFRPALLANLKIAIPAITNAIMPEGCLYSDGGGLILAVAVQVELDGIPMNRTDFFLNFVSCRSTRKTFGQSVLESLYQVNRCSGRWGMDASFVRVEKYFPVNVLKNLGAQYFVEVAPLLERESQQPEPNRKSISRNREKAEKAGWVPVEVGSGSTRIEEKDVSEELVDQISKSLNNAGKRIGQIISAKPSRIRHVNFQLRWKYPPGGNAFIDSAALVCSSRCLLQVVDTHAALGVDGPWGALSFYDDGDETRFFSDSCDPKEITDAPMDAVTSAAAHEQHCAGQEKESKETESKKVKDNETAEVEKLDIKDTIAKVVQESEETARYLPNGRLLRPKKLIKKDPSPLEIRKGWSTIRSSILHSGDILDDDFGVGKHILQMDLALLPGNVRDICFVYSAQSQYTLSLFSDLEVCIFNAEFPDHEMIAYTIERRHNSKSVIELVLSKKLGAWVMERTAIPCEGDAMNYEPVFSAIRHREQKDK